MNIEQAKALSIDELLLKLNRLPTKQTSKGCWYRSPFRDERTASFHTSRDGRAWYDFGEGVGGNIIDLALRLTNGTQVSEALAYIQHLTGQIGYNVPSARLTLPPLKQYAYVTERATPFQVRDQRGHYTANAAYLKTQRGIDPDAFAPYLHDVVYKDTAGRKQYGFGMRNYANGFDVRRSGDFAKTSVGPKSFTHFPAASEPETAPWKAFYGMMDFGTFLTIRRIKREPVDPFHYLIIHGDAVADQAARYVETLEMSSMEHYDHVDVDASGFKAMLKVMKGAEPASGISLSNSYAGFKDINAWWQNRLGIASSAPSVKPIVKNTPKLDL